MLDRIEVLVEGGTGGNGVVSFRREKFVPQGGPDGGDGGAGGNLIFQAGDAAYTLEYFRSKKKFRAADGTNGGINLKTGGRGEDLIAVVPAGTTVLNTKTGELIADLTAAGDEVVVAHGGRGGWGNKRFATSTNQAPRYSQKGVPGEQRSVTLELRLLADVGLLGLPNAGKSTFLAAVSNAKPRIADYPFTTLEPMLGVVEVGFERYTLADLPGLVEGASAGYGLGLEFLKHVRRCRVLLHLVDCSSPDPITDLELIRGELEAFQEDVSTIREVAAVSKKDIDAEGARVSAEKLAAHLGGAEVTAISAVTGEGVEPLVAELLALVKAERALLGAEEVAALPVIRPPDMDRFNVEPAGPARWVVEGVGVVQFVETMDLQMEGAFEEVERRLLRWGVIKELNRLGVQPGDAIVFGRVEIEWEP
ncbi:MAG TPA: GTPase ObgE [Dehalococcoidia bacterium]|nr:GTPase ObgE [Dehalococcoidia bacterium]